MPRLVPSSRPYRPSWEEATVGYVNEGGTFVPLLGPNEFISIEGDGPVWSDNSDSTYVWTRHGMISPAPGITTTVTPYPVADFPAAPGVSEITSVSFRALGNSIPGEGTIAQWVLRNRTTGQEMARNNFVVITDTVAEYTEDPNSGSLNANVRSLLRTGNLCVEVSLGGGTDSTLETFEVWLTVVGEIPDVPVPTVTIRRAVARKSTHATPSLRMLQRGGSGGMSGIPRLMGDPTRRGIRQGPGSIY